MPLATAIHSAMCQHAKTLGGNSLRGAAGQYYDWPDLVRFFGGLVFCKRLVDEREYYIFIMPFCLTLLLSVGVYLVDCAVDIHGKVFTAEGDAGRVMSGAVASRALGAVSGPHTQGARVVLNGFQEVYASSIDGSFSFVDVHPGVHTVEVFQRDFVYMQHKVHVPEDGTDVVVQRYLYPGAPELVAKLPLEIHPVTLVQHFEDRPPSAIWGMVMNPFVLLGLLMMLMMLCVNIDSLRLGSRCAVTDRPASPPPPPYTNTVQLHENGGPSGDEKSAGRTGGGLGELRNHVTFTTEWRAQRGPYTYNIYMRVNYRVRTKINHIKKIEEILAPRSSWQGAQGGVLQGLYSPLLSGHYFHFPLQLLSRCQFDVQRPVN